jgi:hypothetical protein
VNRWVAALTNFEFPLRNIGSNHVGAVADRTRLS